MSLYLKAFVGALVAGLSATIEWYRDNEEWWRPQKSPTETLYDELGLS